MRVLLSVLPSFQNTSFFVAHLGNACIAAYLKKYLPDIQVNTIDLRSDSECKNIWSSSDLPQLTFNKTFVSDIYDLPIIADLINKFEKYHTIRATLEPTPEVISNWALDRSLKTENVINKLTKTNFFALRHLKKFENYDIVGFSLYTTNLYLSILMAILIRLSYPHIKIVFGGPQVTQGETTRELLLKSKVADFLILGEGEQPMLELIQALQQNESVEKIIGIKTLENFSSIDTFSQTANLEELPTPDYLNTDFSLFSPYVVPVYSNRGCPFRCHFCSEHSLFGKKFKRRSPQRVIEDMIELNKRYDIYDFTIADSLINSSDEWLEEFTDILLQKNLDFNWGGYFRAELGKELVEKMSRAGLVSAILGVESFSQQTLNSMNKKKVRQEIIDTINYLVDNNVHSYVNLFVGYPGEKEEDFLVTLDVSNELYEHFRQKNKSEYFRITARNFQMRPFSNVYNSYEKFGLEAESWSSEFMPDYMPENLKNVFDKTLCSFKVKDVSLEDTIHRIIRMKEVRAKTIQV
ncbi:MAG: B12-binding domain-containing radical SAM protein [Candidatus Sericytochromatia bacterium]|nr:B12-binding domain-containing radical SAM protein [Candidatus Sericytochromatia bacterium]